MKNKSDILHIALIIIGAIFISVSIFHSNMWFDESYSVAMARHSFSEIWQIGGTDVHPILYYFCLHILYLIFGNNLMIYRLFSSLTIVLTSLLGYTNIRKDFGNKTGFLFSFFTLFLPVALMYSGELRMYPFGMLLGSIMAIYAYRIYTNKMNKCTFIFFGLASLAVSYTHYYGLIFAGIVNLILFVKLIKERKERIRDLKNFILTAIIQVILYIPWLIYFLKQLKYVATGFWITLKFPDTLIEIFTMQYIGNLPVNIAIIFTVILYEYLAFVLYKQSKEMKKLPRVCFGIYLGIILMALFISLYMQSVILLYRYLVIITGLIIFAISYILALDKNKYAVIIICSILICMSIYTNIINIKSSYATSNRECINFINSQITDTDIIVYSNALNGAVITTEVSNIKNNKSYFYNKDNWRVEESYRAYAPYMEIKSTLEEILDNYTGRIWIIEAENTHDLLNEIDEKYDITKLENKQFKQVYKNYNFTIELIEKN